MFGIKKFLLGLKIVPKTASTADAKGELEVIDSTGKLGYHNGISVSPVITEAHSAALTNKTIIAASNTITTAAAGNLTATELNAALAELDLDIGNVFGDLGAHIIDTIDAHDASAISSIPAGNLAATDVQGAVNELQSDVDTRATSAQLTTHAGLTTGTHGVAGTIVGTSDSQALTNKTIVVTSNTVTTAASGNLAATELNAALSELQTDIDSRALQSDLTTTNTTVSSKITGPASATDEAVARFDGTTGKLVQNSVVTITDAGVAAGLTGLTSSGTVTASGTLATTGSITESFSTDSSTTGANAAVTSPSTPVVRLTNASLTSIDTISSPVAGRVLTIENATGNSISINNDTGGTAANRIYTGTKATLTLADQASIIVKYDSTNSRWMIVGGTGAGGTASLDTVFQLTGGDIPLWSTGDNATFLGGGTLAGTFAANTTTPLQGLSSYKYTQAASSLDDYLASPAQAVDARFRGQECTLFFPFKYDGASNDIQVIFYDATNTVVIPSSSYIQASTTVGIFKTNVVIPSTCASIRVGFQTAVVNNGKIFEFDSVQLSSDTTVYADIANIYQEYHLSQITSALTNAVNETEFNLATATITNTGTPIIVASDDSGNTRTKFTANRKCNVNVSFSSQGSTGNPHIIYKNGAQTVTGTAVYTGNAEGGVAASLTLDIGEYFTVGHDGTIPSSAQAAYLQFVATASTSNILTAPETFSTDTAPLVYAGSGAYTLATLSNAPVGTFITFTYAASSNTATQTTTAPTQTTTDMNSNGFFLTGRAYTALSTAALPCRVDVQIGKGQQGQIVRGFLSTNKDTPLGYGMRPLNTAMTNLNGTEVGYDPDTGVLTLNAGGDESTITTARKVGVRIDTAAASSNGYFTVSASKNPALTGLNINAVAARGVNTAGTSIANSGDVTITYDSTKTYDTHSALNSATGVFTAPETGYYQVSGGIQFGNFAYAINNNIYLIIYKNASVYSYGLIHEFEAAVTTTASSVVSTGVYLVKDETVTLKVLNNRTAGATTLDTGVGTVYFSIHKTSVG